MFKYIVSETLIKLTYIYNLARNNLKSIKLKFSARFVTIWLYNAYFVFFYFTQTYDNNLGS
jgi:hypothetical protein